MKNLKAEKTNLKDAVMMYRAKKSIVRPKKVGWFGLKEPDNEIMVIINNIIYNNKYYILPV